MSDPIYLYVNEPTISLNVYARMHWARRKKELDRWEKLLLVESRRAGATKATGKRNVLCRRIGKRKLDADNLAASFKMPIDALVRLGLLKDDNDTWATFRFEQQTAAGAKPHTIIALQNVKDAEK